MAEPAGDDETFTRGIEKARAALSPQVRPRPRSVPAPATDDDDAAPPAEDLEARVATLEAQVRDLRAALARILDARDR